MALGSKIVFVVLPLLLMVVAIIVFFGESGAWEEVKDLVLETKEVLPEVGIGLDELSADVSIPATHKDAILRLERTINGGMLGEKENCFASFDGLPELEEKGTSLNFALRGNKTVLTVKGGSGGKQIITDLHREFSGMKPCVVAGIGGVADNFHDYFFAGQRERLIHPYFQGVGSLTIGHWDGGYTGISGNHIQVESFDEDTVNDEGNNFENGGWLFTPDGEHVCFFPTNKEFDADDDGLENDFFEIGENSIANKITENKLKLCEVGSGES
tara:strand:+ start:205 stop:1017 length:813 start_codon:yes stop_codon:yes gene_type:complete